MNTRELYNIANWSTVQSNPILDADANGTAIDLQGYNGCLVGVFIGAPASAFDASNYVQLEMEEADETAWGSGTPGAYTDVAEAHLINPIASTTTGAFALINDAAEDETIYWVAYIGTKRYIRVHFEYTGAPGAGYAVTLAGKTQAVYQPAN